MCWNINENKEQKDPQRKDAELTKVEAIVDSLRWEYGLIQAKIDKYGEIAVRIKGLMIPLAAASTYYTFKEGDIKIPCYTLVATLIFLWYETLNHIYKRTLQARAIFIERQLRSSESSTFAHKFMKMKKPPYQIPMLGENLKDPKLFVVKNIRLALNGEWKANLIYYVLLFFYDAILIYLQIKEI